MNIQAFLFSLCLCLCFFSCDNATTETTTVPTINDSKPTTEKSPTVNPMIPIVDKTLLIKKWKVTLWESADLLDIMGDDYEAYKATQMAAEYNFTASEKGNVTIDGKTMDCDWNLSNNAKGFKMRIGDDKVKYMTVKGVTADLLQFEWDEDFTWKNNPPKKVKTMMQLEPK